MVVVASGLLIAYVALASLTAHGARRRGAPSWVTVISGIAFPLAWTAWYVLDEHPFRRGRRAA